MRHYVAPAIHFGSGKTQAAEDGSDIGAMLNAVVDDLDEEAAGLVVEGVAVFLRMDDLVGLDALDGTEKGGGHIAWTNPLTFSKACPERCEGADTSEG